MKLAEIQIDRCGVWRDLTLALECDGLSVLYGPNETGKSTLVQFIRGILYGFAPAAEGYLSDPGGQLFAAGSLVLDDKTKRRRVHRSAIGATRGNACLIGDEGAGPANEFLAEVLHGLDERAFQAAFTVDLPQLQELAALPADEATARIYDVALGPDGHRLLAAGRRAESRRSRLVDPLQQDGELVRLFERHDQLIAELHDCDRAREQHAEWCHERDRLEDEAADLRERRAGIREQLRGHEFLERASEPWQHTRDCRRELDTLSTIHDFPERGLERLERIETEIAAAAESRDRLLSDVKQLREQRKPNVTSNPRLALAGTMQGFVEQRGWLVELQERCAAAARQLDDADHASQASLECLGSEWTPGKVKALDLSPAGWQRLAGTAQSLREALQRRQALRRKRRRLATGCRELRDSLAECLHDLNGESVDLALNAARERLRQMNHLARLQLREAELNQRQFSLLEHRERIAPQLTLPRWVYIVLGVFSFMGIILAGWGLIAGVVTSGIAGAIYAMLGITCGGLALGLKTQYEGDARRRIDEADAQLAAALADLNETRTSIARLAEKPTSEAGSPATAPIDGGDLVRRAAERVAELVDLAQHQRNFRSMRRRLEETRQKLEVARREVETARESWCGRLQELGLPDSIPADQALESWQQLLEARAGLENREQAHAAHKAVEGVWNSCRQRIAEFGRRMEDWDADYDRPIEILEKWEKQLVELGRLRDERRELRTQIRTQQRAASKQRARVNELKVQRDALLVQGGAASRDEFEDRARQVVRRACLEKQLADAERDLEAICSEHTDLALVEDDLLAFNVAENAKCIETLKLEAADLEHDLQQALETLASVQREIHTIENDRTATSLRFEIEQIRQELQQSARNWACVELAAQSTDDLRREFERRHQPAALIDASRFLARLSQGRYPSVWTPLGERRLMVDDDRGRSLPASALSRGTREQLFLAVRLAIVEDLARKGTALPLILDDVFVNFDESRAEAAAAVLCDFAQAGHQVLLFTCHLHLARLFQAKGIEPVWLPDRRAERDSREEKRRAG